MTNKSRNIPHFKHTFLVLQGLNIEPCQEFVDKYVEIYNELMHKNKIRKHVPDIDENTARYFILTTCESIIHCLDFGLDVWLSRVMVFLQKNTDYRHNVKRHRLSVIENVKKLTFKPVSYLELKIKALLNKDNKPFQEHLQQKKESYNKIKQYYKEFYGKEDEWWQYSN